MLVFLDRGQKRFVEIEPGQRERQQHWSAQRVIDDKLESDSDNKWKQSALRRERYKHKIFVFDRNSLHHSPPFKKSN